eukprot:c25256_g1_i1.p1 GENE.c25256_g1_i1~~c25256_g1_i1.p1  ORF type:complete len:2949 (+),score=651.92 c25256_g1_i1:1898-10744(+)
MFKSDFGTAACQACPNNSTSPEASVSMDACACDVGYTSVPIEGGGHRCAANKCSMTALNALVGVNAAACDGKTTTESCTVSCRRGYTGASATFGCTTSGEFSGAITCVADPCVKPAPVVGVSFKGCVGVTTDHKCNVSCAAGFAGEPTVFGCESDARIHGDLPQCVALPCNPVDPEVGYDYKDCNGKTTFQTCTLKCDQGYYAPGTKHQTETLNCMDTAFISTRTLQCELSHCQPPAAVVGVDLTVLTPPLEVGSQKQIACEPGYTATFSTTVHSFIPIVAPDTSIQAGTEKAVIAKPRQTNLTIRPALSLTPYAVSLMLADGKYLRNKAGLLVFEAPQDTMSFQESASFFLERSTIGTNNWMLRAVDFPSRYVRVKDSGLFLHAADSEDIETEFNRSATFMVDPVATALPATLPSIYQCSRGGVYIGIPPACNPNTCATHKPVKGIMFDNCNGTKTHEKCTAVCAKGYTRDPNSGDGLLTCKRDGSLEGQLPVCVPNVCAPQQFPARVDHSACEGKKTGEVCSVKCEAGYSASAPLLKKFGTTVDMNLAPWAAGVDRGCQPCGFGGYSEFPCIRGDPITPCRNWCAATHGCNNFAVMTEGDNVGYCCRLTGIPPRDSKETADFQLHSMSADLVAVTMSTSAKNLDDLRGACSEFLGLGLASLRGSNRLETISDLLQSQGISNGVPFGYRTDAKSPFLDFSDPFVVVDTILAAANSNSFSAFSGQRAWTSESPNLLVGLQRGVLSTLSFAGVQAVVCERTLTCMDTGKLVGELPTCTANPCTQPVNTGADLRACFGLKTGESCDVVCRANRQNLTTTYDLAEAFRGPMVSHSFMPYLPSGNLSVALNFKVTTEELTWARGNLATFGGSVDECCSGGVELFTQSDDKVRCPPRSGLFAIGFGAVCDKADRPLMTECKFAKDTHYSVQVWTNGDTFKVIVDGKEQAVGSRQFAPRITDERRGFQVSYLSSCHNSVMNFVSSEVQYTKIWTEDGTSHLTCQANGGFLGTIPCAQTKCIAPQVPLGVDFANCSDKRTGETCQVSCHDGSPSIDLAFTQPETLADPKRGVEVSRIPRGTVNIAFVLRAEGGETDWEFQNVFVLGGDVETCCGGGVFAFTTTEDVGCPVNSGQFAIGFGTACVKDAILTSCLFEAGATYEVHIVQSSEFTKIFVDGVEVASNSRHYHLDRIGSSTISFLTGCHGHTLAPFQGEISDFEIYSEIAQYTLTCASNGTFTGDMPTCLERNCRTPSRSSGIDFSDCIRRKSGESCIAKCAPGYSEDGKGSNDVRNDAILWLEASELSGDHWVDHRGNLFSARFSVVPFNLKFDAKAGGVRFSSDDTYIRVDGLDISPGSMPEVTLEAWVKLDKVANARGWLISNDDNNYARGIMLHNSDFGEGHVPSLAIGVGNVYKSKLGTPVIGEWLHVVACFDMSGVSHLYVNGVKEVVHHAAPAKDEFAQDSLVVGGHPTSFGQFVSGAIASLRVYDEFLDAESVKQLLFKGRTFNPVVAPTAPTSSDVRQSAILWLQASDISGTAWEDHRGASHDGSDFSVKVVNAKYDQATRGLRVQDDTTYAVIQNLNLSPAHFPALTIEVWFQLFDAKGQGWLVSQDDGGFDRSMIAHDASFGDSASAMGVGYAYESGADKIETNEWTHLVGVWEDGGQCQLYKNGLPFQSVQCTNDRTALDFVVIGKHPSIEQYSINGSIATVRFYGKALSHAQVAELYRVGDPAVPISSAESVSSSAWISLDARDVAGSEWHDHRTAGDREHKAAFSVSVTDAAFDKNQRALRMGSSSRVTIPKMDINPSSNEEVTLELWVKLHAISANNRGRVFGNGNERDSRSIFLQDAAFGPGQGIQSAGMTVGPLYESSHGYLETNQWVHLVAVFSQSQPCFFYKDGIPERVTLAGLNAEGEATVILGSRSASDYLDGWVSVARVYRVALSNADVLALYRGGHYASEPARVASPDPRARACEGDKLELACTGGKTIHITSTMYGRTSADVCGQGTNTNCRSPSSLNMVMSHCEGKPSCSIPVTPKEFGADPCAGTRKYLEVDFECLGATPVYTPVTGDVRASALVWLESRDTVVVNKVQTLSDHRGSAYAQGLSVRFMKDVKVDGRGMRLGGGSSIELRGFDFSEASLPELSVEAWVMLDGLNDGRGFAFGTGPTSDDRAVYLHDEKQGGGQQSLLANHSGFDGGFGEIGVGEWHHIVAVWSNHGHSVLYKDGVALPAEHTTTQAAKDVFLIGASEAEFISGWVASVRVYSYALEPLQVESLLLQHPKPVPWMEVVEDSAELFTCSADGQFYGSSPVCVKNTCNAPIPQVGVDFAACHGLKTGEACSVGCADGFTGEVLTFDQPTQNKCGMNQGFDVVKGVSLQQCKLACENGVMNCQDNCDKRVPVSSNRCNALEYDQSKKECTIYAACDVTSGYRSLDIEFIRVSRSLTSTFMCDSSGQFEGIAPTCQRDLPDGGSNLACEDASVLLSCPKETRINVLRATYGRLRASPCGSNNTVTDCQATKALSIVKQQCHDKESCEVHANSKVFGDPCPGVSKYLEVDYECRKIPARVPQSVLACEDDPKPLEIGCSGDTVIHIESVMYGRQKFDICPCGDRGEVRCRLDNASQVVRSFCEGKTACTVYPTVAVMGGHDPCPGISKYLDVKYECVASSDNGQACESETLKIDCDTSKNERIHIRHASFGRLNPDVCKPQDFKGNLNVECRSPSSLEVAVATCEGQSSCSLVASAAAFGDACPGVPKYLEVDHECIAAPPSVRECHDHTAVLACSGDRHIHVTSAQYGRDSKKACPAPASETIADPKCGTVSVLDIAKEHCEGTARCELDVTAHVLGHEEHCAGSAPYLDLEYMCLGETPAGLTCEGAVQKIDCKDKTIRVTSASFGRTSFTWCAHPARVNLNCVAPNALEVAKKICDGNKSCSVGASTQVFGDPCPGTYKYLTIEHECV